MWTSVSPWSEAVPDQVRGLMASWDRLNPGWEIRFYDDAMCLHFVRTEFPEYYNAYLALPKVRLSKLCSPRHTSHFRPPFIWSNVKLSHWKVSL
jgi:hypothetical protein